MLNFFDFVYVPFTIKQTPFIARLFLRTALLQNFVIDCSCCIVVPGHSQKHEYSKRNALDDEMSRLFLKDIKKTFFLALIVMTFQGCSSLSGHQSPAPVSTTEPTNPYFAQPVLKTTPLASVKNSPQLQKIEQVKPLRPRYDEYTGNQSLRKPLTPAVLALVSEAERNSKSGDLESAVVTIERALRIDSRNPSLIYKLAQLRLKQSKPRLAEDLAKKTALLSGKDKSLKRKSWLLISEARRQQKNYFGAKEARRKAAEM